MSTPTWYSLRCAALQTATYGEHPQAPNRHALVNSERRHDVDTREQIAELQRIARATAEVTLIAGLQGIARATAEEARIAELQRIARESERAEEASRAA